MEREKQRRRRRRSQGEQMKRWVEHTEVWEELETYLLWPEQWEYELIRSIVDFGDPVTGRAIQTGVAHCPQGVEPLVRGRFRRP